MTDKPKIRAYKPSDKPALLEILKLNIPVYFAESELDDLNEYLEHRVEMYFVAEIENKIVGAGGINFDGTTGKISWDFIHPEFRGKSIGQQLLNYRIDLLKSMKNIKNVTVRTSQLAYKFYQKNGFTLKEVTKNYWAKGLDLYSMIYEHTI